MSEPDDWSAAQIMAAISSALKAHDMEAVAALMRLLAVKDPASAELLLAGVEFLSGTPRAETEEQG